MCQTGGEEQRWRDQAGRGGAEKVAENKVELPGSLSAVIYQHPAPFFGQQVLDRQKAPDIPVSTLELTQWKQNAMETPLLRLSILSSKASLNNCW